MRLKILSYNIHKGFSANNRKFVLRRMREAIRGTHADIVLLQEVQGEHEKRKKRVADWPLQSQFEFLADEIWPHFAYGKNAVYTAGHHGNAVISRFPITFWENIDVSSSRIERRGLLHVVIKVPRFGNLHAICVHLGLFEKDRTHQVKRICQRIESHVLADEPLVIGGDFNDWKVRASGPLKKNLDVEEAFLKSQGKHARTFPSWMPALRLDRIYYRGMKLSRAECLVDRPWRELSDHAALTAEFDLLRRRATSKLAE
ncbi:MAG: endonuclease/exonuclease/phosphatase family protein [Oligoflexia bacterium]|nr:endonuclease/exonuclease/phosphatase family protein [Oligoflexia bacterium]